MEGLTLNEIELKLFLLKKRTRKAIERNEATILRLQRANHERDGFLASLEGRPPPILEDDSLYNTSLGSSTVTEHSDPEPFLEDSVSSSAPSSFDELRDDQVSSVFTEIEENERHDIDHDSSLEDSFESSVSTTASSTASRMEAFLQMASSEERRILARLDRLRSRVHSQETAMARNGSASQDSSSRHDT